MAHYYHCHISSLPAWKAVARTAEYISRSGGYARCANDAIEIFEFCIPAFASDASHFFAESDKYERANACKGKHINIALPNDCDHTDIVSAIIAPFISKNLPMLCAVHHKSGNKHLHILISERMQDDYTFSLSASQFFSRASTKKDGVRTGGARKMQYLSGNRAGVIAFRKHVADSINRYVPEDKDKVDHRSYFERGLNKLPGRHRGPSGHPDMHRHRIHAMRAAALAGVNAEIDECLAQLRLARERRGELARAFSASEGRQWQSPGI